MNEMESCFVCRKHKGLEPVPGGAIFEDALVYVGHSWSIEEEETPYLGGLIVEPKRHVATWAELQDTEAETIGRAIRDVSRALRAEENVEHIYVFVLGHHIPHLHIWVIPRYVQTPREYWGFNIFDWPGRPFGEAAQVEAFCKQVRARL